MSGVFVFRNFCASTVPSQPSGGRPRQEGNPPLRCNVLHGHQPFRQRVCRYGHHPAGPAHIGRTPGGTGRRLPLPHGSGPVGRRLPERRGRFHRVPFPGRTLLQARGAGFHAPLLLCTGGPVQGPAGRGGERRHRPRGAEKEDGHLLHDGSPHAGEGKSQAGLRVGAFSRPVGRSLPVRFPRDGGFGHLCRGPRSLRLHEYGPGPGFGPVWRRTPGYPEAPPGA